jgi:hypothetical protein
MIPPPVHVQALPLMVVLTVIVGTLVGGYYLAKKAGGLTSLPQSERRWARLGGLGIRARLSSPPEAQPLGTAPPCGLPEGQRDALRRELGAQRRLREP